MPFEREKMLRYQWDGEVHKNFDEALNYLIQKRMNYIMKRGVDKNLADRESDFLMMVNQRNDYIQILEKEEQIYGDEIYGDEDYGGHRGYFHIGHPKNILGERDKT